MYLVLPRIMFYSTQQNRPTGKSANMHLSILVNNTFESTERLFQGYYTENLKLFEITRKQNILTLAGLEPWNLQSQSDTLPLDHRSSLNRISF